MKAYVMNICPQAILKRRGTQKIHRPHLTIRERLLKLFYAPDRLIEVLFLLVLGASSASISVGINSAYMHLQTHVRDATASAWPHGAFAAFATFASLSLILAAAALATTVAPPAGFGAHLYLSRLLRLRTARTHYARHTSGSRHAVGSGIPEMKAILSGYWLSRYLSPRAFIFKVREKLTRSHRLSRAQSCLVIKRNHADTRAHTHTSSCG